MKDHSGRTVLHIASVKGPEYMHTILDRCPESERLQVLDMTDRFGSTVLHSAAQVGQVDCINTTLSFYPEAERLRAMSTQDARENTVLHCAASSGSVECIEAILSLYPESERQQALNVQNQSGKTVWDLTRGLKKSPKQSDEPFCNNCKFQ